MRRASSCRRPTDLAGSFTTTSRSIHSRSLRGIDPQEFETLVSAVGKFADQFDDQLIAEFYMDQPESTNQVDSSGVQMPQTD